MKRTFLILLLLIITATCLYGYGNMRPDLRMSMKTPIVSVAITAGTEIVTVAGSALVTVAAATIVTP